MDPQLSLLKSRLRHWTPGEDGTYYACCPAHNDSHPSLAIKHNPETGNVLMWCWSHECSGLSILNSIGCKFEGPTIKADRPGPELSAEDKEPVELKTASVFDWPVTQTYIYTDGEGNEVLKVQRRDTPEGLEPRRKVFFQYTQDPAGRWVPKVLPGAKIPPYNLDHIKQSGDAPIYVVEGEKAADALIAKGMVATTNPGGANRWNKIDKSYAQVFNNRHIVILPDADGPGREHAVQVALALEEAGAASVKVVDLYSGITNKKDVYDYLQEGGTPSKLIAKVLETPQFRQDPKSNLFTLPSGSEFVCLAHPSLALKGRDFLVPKVMMTGALTLLAGKGSAGKSSLCGHLAACISQGRPAFRLHPENDYMGRVPKGNVIWVSKEEGPETELAARLVSEGACLERIFVLKQGSLNLDAQDEVDQLLTKRRPLLIILDPLTSYIGGDENSNKGVRATLENLLQSIHRHGLPTVILGLVHLNKTGKDEEADVNKLLGSVGLPNLSRSTLIVRKNKDNTRAVAIAKANFRSREDELHFGIASLTEAEAFRVIEASGMTVAADKRKIAASMCRVECHGWFEPSTEKDSKNEKRAIVKEIQAALKDEPGGLDEDAIAASMGATVGQVNNVLWAMKREGLVDKRTVLDESSGVATILWFVKGVKPPASASSVESDGVW